MVNGAWHANYNSADDVNIMAQCDLLPEQYVAGCKLFSQWGWKTPLPSAVKYKKVACPAAFSNWVGKQFNSDGIVPQQWYGNHLHLTHFWDCSGMGCDSSLLKWVSAIHFQEHYVAAPGYAPQDPELHGGSVYGEKIWLTGAASDTLAELLGESDACCGLDYSSPGCGKCLLVQDPDAVNSDWTAVVMKKSRCPPESKGCEPGNAHFDLAVPGFDYLDESTANVCADRKGTLFTGKLESGALGDWPTRSTYANGTCVGGCSLADPIHMDRCDWLPPEFAKGCRLFAEWGWTQSPMNVRYRRVECPENFVKWVKNLYNESGVVHLHAEPVDTTTLTTTTSTTTTTNTTSTTTTTRVTSTSTLSNTMSHSLFMQATKPSLKELYKQTSLSSTTNAGVASVVASTLSIFVLFSCFIVICGKTCTCSCARSSWPSTRHRHHKPVGPRAASSTSSTATQ
jgi:hypothetical protein